MRNVMGWDIGGAHVKAVLLDEAGNVVHTQQVVCQLWLGLDQLKAAMVTVLSSVNIVSNDTLHAVTMTGELVDLFENRHDGVIKIAEFVDTFLNHGVQFYCIDADTNTARFVTIALVSEHTKVIASANWHASACLCAKAVPNALLIDIGSTTTDMIVVEGGQVMNRALTDAERLQQDTLIYTGVVRTPVMAVAQKIQFQDKVTNVVAEYFATMADVYRLTEELDEAVDMAETADGQPKSVLASARRLARMVGYDVEEKSLVVWQQLAQSFRDKQCHQVRMAIEKNLKGNMTIIGAGAGHFLVEAIARSLNMPYMALSAVLEQPDDDLAVCLPAYAVASLLKGYV